MVSAELLENNDSSLSIGLATPPPEVLLTPNIGVMGVGGAGGNAVNNMVSSNLEGVSFFVANTDAQALSRSLVADRIQLGVALTQGLGAGANPEIGRAAAEETKEKIQEALKGLHLLFITAGMGGGTGTGAAPIVAQLAKEMGILTVGVVSKPFRFEGGKRMKTAEGGICELQKWVDTLIVIPNQNLFRVAGDKTTFGEAFQIADDVLCQGVRSITDLVMNPGMINLDFADVRTVLSAMGRAMMGTGEASGEGRAEAAAEKAISNPLLDDSSVKGAKSILINICGGSDLTLNEVDLATERIVSELDPDANVIFGTSADEELNGIIRISLVATGIERSREEKVIFTPSCSREPNVTSVVPSQTETSPTPVLTEEPQEIPTPEEKQPALIEVPEMPPMRQPIAPQPFYVSKPEMPQEISEPNIVQPPLFSEEPPAIPPVRPISVVPDIQPPINVEVKKEVENVKPVRGPFGLPGLGGTLFGRTPAPKKQPPKEPADPTLSDFEAFDLPSFFKGK